MKPTKLIPGQQITVTNSLGLEPYDCEFIKRIPSIAGRKPRNMIRCPAFADSNSGYDGTMEISDYDVTQRVHLVKW